MKAIILAAGKGTRMWPLGETRHKLLMPVYNQPLLNHFVEILKDHVEEIIIVVDGGNFGQSIKDYVNKSNFQIKISFAIEDDKAAGTGYAFQCASGLIQPEEDLIMMYGDDYYFKEDIESVLKYDYACVGKKVTDPEKWGIFQTDSEDNLIQLIEKPIDFVGDRANIGIYHVKGDIFNYYEKISISIRGEYEFTDTLSFYAQDHKIKVLQSYNWIPIGYPWHILNIHEELVDTQEYKNEGEVEQNAVIKGRLKLGKGSVIKSGTYIEGDVIIGENCIIGPNAYIRGVSVIGDNCKIGAFCEIKNSTLFSDTKVPHLSLIGDSIIGQNVNIAAGTIVANLRHDGENVKTLIKGNLIDTARRKFGTVIGDNAKLGIGTRIYPGRKIAANATTLPSQVVKEDLMLE